jgi:hypothetical protein
MIRGMTRDAQPIQAMMGMKTCSRKVSAPSTEAMAPPTISRDARGLPETVISSAGIPRMMKVTAIREKTLRI